MFILIFISDIFTVDFVNFLLDKIDSPPENDEDEQIPDLFVNLILAYNLHFRGKICSYLGQ